MLTKLRDWIMWIFTKGQLKAPEDVQYFEAKHFFNDLDTPSDYYLKVSSTEKNIFVRKDKVDDN